MARAILETIWMASGSAGIIQRHPPNFKDLSRPLSKPAQKLLNYCPNHQNPRSAQRCSSVAAFTIEQSSSQFSQTGIRNAC